VKTLLPIVLIAIFSISLLSGCGKSSKERMKLNGTKLSINTKLYEMEMEKETDKKESYVLVAMNPKQESEDYYDMIFLALPLEKAKELTRQYGTFFG
jgi:N-acetyl-gamma-glutamylphosphate reductase